MPKRNVGSITEKRPGVWRVQVDASKLRLLTPEDWASPTGRRHRRVVTVEGTREDAERQLHAMQYYKDNGTLPAGRITLNTWLEYWLREYVAVKWRETTHRDYVAVVRRDIGPALGAMYLDDIKAHHIQEFQTASPSA